MIVWTFLQYSFDDVLDIIKIIYVFQGFDNICRIDLLAFNI